jgi:tRNA pseudouridine38-40 synthase
MPERRIAVLLEYDGTAYCGLQYQENGPTVQHELESALERLTGAPRRVAFAGRTDAGVHALGQVGVFDADARLEATEYVRGLNHHLPHDIALRAAVEVDPAFDPRRDATWRAYRYRIVNRPARSPLERNRAWHVDRPLDVAAMQSAATVFEGKHDFAAFAGPYDGSTERTVDRCEVQRRGCGELRLEVQARAFLPHQVRRMTAALVDVGLGRDDADAIATSLRTPAADSRGATAPACGLYLAHIEYGGLAFEPLAWDGRTV